MAEFKSDWNLLQSVPWYSAKYSANSGANRSPVGARDGGDLLTRK
jgi:hypothetical protein